MRLTEQFKNRLKKLAGITELDSKSPQHIALKKGKGQSKSYDSEVSCNDPNWIGMPNGDSAGGPNYSWFKHDYCDRCGYNWSGNMPTSPVEVFAYIGVGAAPGDYSEITWNIGPPTGAEIPNADPSWSLGNFCPCCDESTIGDGCTDPTANNYDPEATVDDGSCLIEMFMCINCEVVSIGMVPLYENAVDWSGFNPDAFGGSGAYSLGYLYPNSIIENEYISLNGAEIYENNLACGVDSIFSVNSYPENAFDSCVPG